MLKRLAGPTLSLLVLAGCGTGSLPPLRATVPDGEVSLTAAGETRTFRPERCQSGEWRSFNGADFRAGDDVVRVIVPPEGGASVRVFSADSPIEPGVVFDRAACSQFELSLGRSGWEVNDVAELTVDLRFTCANANGDSASGTLHSEHCR